jgi:phosphoenolpyruvate synthase/pyruvate phosphate dikinase|tara:strand:- start:398 stop:544 length:147 start_codon:yes stop_codon:yes gene_type:complete
MIQNLSNFGVKISVGYAIIVDAYWDFINHNKLRFKEIFSTLEKNNKKK